MDVAKEHEKENKTGWKARGNGKTSFIDAGLSITCFSHRFTV
jgi:hypothetical protein